MAIYVCTSVQDDTASDIALHGSSCAHASVELHDPVPANLNKTMYSFNCLIDLEVSVTQVHVASDFMVYFIICMLN